MGAISRRLINRSYRRIKKLGARKEGEKLYTADPAALEVAIAQVDATLAVAVAIGDASVELRLLRHPEPSSYFSVPPFGSKAKVEAYIGAMEQDIQYLQVELERLLKAQGQTPTPKPLDDDTAPPWWIRLWNSISGYGEGPHEL